MTTIKDLDRLTKWLNEITGNPVDYWSVGPGKGESMKQAAGHYYTSSQCGGYRLEQLDDHGARDVFPYRTTKKQLENDIRRFIEGIILGKQLIK